jgi:hypothetical protein
MNANDTSNDNWTSLVPTQMNSRPQTQAKKNMQQRQALASALGVEMVQ